MLTLAPKKNLSYAFCSDTAYKPSIVTLIENTDLLYHEATFLKDKKELAETTKHSTAEQAALIAKKAKVSKLILGHYSSRYKNIEEFKDEAAPIFENVCLAKSGQVFEIKS